MTFDDFILKYAGKKIDFDGAYGNQCVDLYRFYVKEVLGYPQSPGVSGAYQIFDNAQANLYSKISNTPSGAPQKGDIMIWNKAYGGYGHVGVVVSASSKSFKSFDQNHTGKLDACQIVTHNYTNVRGWLRPKSQPEEDNMEKLPLVRLPDGRVFAVLMQGNAMAYVPTLKELHKYWGPNPNVRNIADPHEIDGYIVEDVKQVKASLIATQGQIGGLKTALKTCNDSKRVLSINHEKNISELRAQCDERVDKAVKKAIKDEKQLCKVAIEMNPTPVAIDNWFTRFLSRLFNRKE